MFSRPSCGSLFCVSSELVNSGDPRYALVYAESLRAITTQESSLDNVRARAAQLLTAASVATSVLGGLVHAQNHRPQPATWLAIASFLALLADCVWIVLPTRGWSFVSSASVLLDGYVEAEPPFDLNEMHRSLAVDMEQHWDRNQDQLNRRLGGLQAAAILLVASIVCWLVDLVT
jgi:hypothetical protein